MRVGIFIGLLCRKISGGGNPPVDDGDALLIESGDFLLLENGDKLLLEA